MSKLAAAVIFAATLHPALLAQDAPALPDPAGIVVPDLSGSSSPAVIAGGGKYFFFHQDGVSFEQAHADFTECSLFVQPSSWESVNMNRFVPWFSKGDRRTVHAANPYGLIGVALVAAVEGGLSRRDQQAKMRVCMETRGYSRYGVAEAIWNRVTSLPPDESLAVQAKIASGPSFGKQVPNQ
ncbi:MAG: hypothetical protein M3Q69_14550 [Acidobacteriota bacterium]|nr:hypothetical protein [Acidobacteriota bacterium]